MPDKKPWEKYSSAEKESKPWEKYSEETPVEQQPAAVQPPAKKKSLVSRSPWEGIIPSVASSDKTEQQPAASSSVKKAEAPVDLNKGTEKGEIYKGLPIKGFEDKTYVLKNVNGIDVWQEYNTKNKDVVIGKANKYLSLSKEGVAEGGLSGGEKQKNAKLALTQLAGKLGVDVSSTDGPDDIYQKIQSSKELGETYKNITDPTRIKTLNQNFKAQASTTEGVQTYVGYTEKGKEDNEYRISELPITKEKVWEVKRKGQGDFTVISDEGSINALNNWTGNKVEPNDDAKTKRDAQIARQESAVNNFKLVNSKMFDLAEEDAVPYLQKMYSKYGFNFSESGLLGKDEVTVTSSRGGEPITFSLDNWSEGANASESAKLRRWMIENQSTGDYIDKEREAVKQAQDDYRNSKYEQEKLTPEQIKLQSTSDLQRPIISNPLDAKNKLSAPAEFKQELAANTIMTNKINAQRRLSDLSNSAKTQKQKDEVATIAVANQNVLKQEADVQATYLNDLSKQNKQLNNSVFKLKQDTENFYNGLRQQGITPEQLNTDPELLRQKQELDERAKNIESASNNLSADMSAVKALNKENEKNAGLYIAFNENRGNVMGGLVNSVLKGVGALPDAILNNISGGDDNFASNALISLLGSDYTTEEFMKSEDRWDLTKAAFGGVESLGAMATGSGLGKIVGGGAKLMAISEELPFFALSYNELKSEMKGPEWDGATTAEKEGLALIYAYINGKLEKLGTDALIDTGKISKDVSKNLILKTIAGLKPGATTEAMDLALQTNFKKFILSSAYTLGKDFASEAKTGAMQELTGITLKNTYNLIKGKEMFKEVPNTIADITDAVISGAYMEGLGGLAFSMPKVAVDAGKFGYSKAFKDPEKLAFAEKIFNDSDMRVMILNDIKTKIASGEITKDEGQERVDAINNTVGLFEKMPEGIKEEDKPKTLDLLVEKSKLEQDIKGKDEALIVPQKERITEINNELTNISKNATKEGNITESNLTERENGNEVGKTAETSGSNSTIESGENQKEVEKLRADEQAELAEAIPNIDDYKVDGEIDKEKIKASKDGAKYQEIYDKYDKLITPLLPKTEEQPTAKTNDVESSKPILSEKIDVSDNRNRKGLVPISELEDFIGEDRTGNAEMTTSRETIDKLKKDISENGFKEPIVIIYDKFSNGGEASIIEGNHRIVAAKELGLKEIPVIFEKGTLRTNESRVSEGMFPLNRKVVGEIDTRFGLPGASLGLTVRQPNQNDFISKKQPTEQPTTLEEVKSLDVSDPTNLKKVQSFLDDAIAQLDAFGKETLGMNLPVAVAKAVLKTVRTLLNASVGLTEAIKKAAEIHKVSELDVVDVMEAVQNKQKESEASKAAKDISKKDNTKVTVNERVALKDQLRMEAKAARESAMNIKKKQRALADSIKAMAKAGKITASQSANLLRKLSNLNVDNEDTTQDFLDYADRLFANAEYSDKVDKGFKAKAKIKAKLKSKNQAQVTAIAKEFATIDPSLVTDIDKYNEMADAMLAAIAPSVSGVKKNEEGEYEANNKLKTPINIADVQSYVEKALKAQKEIEKQRLLSYYKELVEAGILNDKMSIEEIREVVANENNDDDKLTAKERAKIVMDDLKERFAVAKSAIEDILSEKVNVERDEEIDALNDDETYTLIYPSKDEIPEFLKDSVSSFSKTTSRKGLFGKKKSFENYKVVATGKQIKEKYYSFEKQNENISESDREIIKRLMSLDLTDMKIKDAMALVDAANNFIENGITAGLRNEVPKHEGNANMKELRGKGFIAKSIGFMRGFGTKKNTLGKTYATQAMSPATFADTMFGEVKGSKFLEKIGFQDLYQGIAIAKTKGGKIIDNYLAKFKKTKPNGQKFNTPFNTYERGVYASLSRSIMGTDAEMKNEFDTELSIIKESTKKLLESNEPHLVRKGKAYAEVLEKLGLNKENPTIKTLKSNVDPINMEATDWWINEWQQHYSDLSDISLAVYNIILGQDNNYTPRRASKIDQASKESDLGEENGSAFATSLNLEESKAGVLKETNKKPLSENKYRDLDFDSNMQRSLEEALVDINTAEAIRTIRGAFESKYFKEIIPQNDVRQRFVDKIDRYVKIKKGKGLIQDEDARKLERTLAVFSKYSTSRTLGTIMALPAQAIPTLASTFIKTGRFDFKDSFSPDAIQWLIDNGASASIRNPASLDSIKRINEKGLRLSSSKLDSALTKVEKYDDFWLRQFLSKGDVYAATSSWFSYYKQSLKRQGLSTDIDWKNHKINKEAFGYANYMVDKTQNPSDSDLAGNIYSSQIPIVRILRNYFSPYSGFSMNQKVRIHSDFVNSLNGDNKADSRISFGAGLVEVLSFNAVKFYTALYIYKAIAQLIMGDDEDEEELKKIKEDLKKDAIKQIIQDLTSPAPVLDFATIKTSNVFIDKLVESGISEDEIKKAFDKQNESNILKGKDKLDESKFKEDYINKKKEEYRLFVPKEEIAGGTYAGIIKSYELTKSMYDLAVDKKVAVKHPDGTYTYKDASENAVKAGGLGLTLVLAHDLGILPGDASRISRIILKKAKATAEKPNIKKVADNFKKDLGLKELTQYQKDMIKSGTSLDNMIKNEYEITLYGGLNTPAKQESFKKITDVFGKNIDLKAVVLDINSGLDTKKIINNLKSDILSKKIVEDIRKESSDIKKEVKKEVMIDLIKNSRK